MAVEPTTTYTNETKRLIFAVDWSTNPTTNIQRTVWKLNLSNEFIVDEGSYLCNSNKEEIRKEHF